MSERIALYRKYRPKLLSDIVGQDHVKRTITNAVEANRLSHAYLFSGIRGSGKSSLSKILACIINAGEKPSTIYDPDRGIAKSILDGTCQDVHILDCGNQSSVDDTRNLRDMTYQMPLLCRKRVFILEEVHLLRAASISALLLTLEEGLANFILCTTEPNKILSTIHSRCQRFELKRINIDQIASHLKDICNSEGIKEVSEVSLQMIAKASGGSLRDALSTLDQVIARCGDNIDDAEVADIVGNADSEVFTSLLEGFLSLSYLNVAVAVKKAMLSGADPEKLLTGLIEFAHEMMIAKCIKNYSHIYLDPQTKDRWVKLFEGLNINQLRIIIDTVSEYLKGISYLPRVDIVLDACCVAIVKEFSKLKKV